MNSRVYVCHTYYHVYVTFLKELKLRAESKGQVENDVCDIVLSTMSINFDGLKERIESVHFFTNVYLYNEQREDVTLQKLKVDTKSFTLNLVNRIKFTNGLSRLQEGYIPVDLKKYDDIYVFCDLDPIGYYLNKHKIEYHAVEDGLNCLKNFDAARYDNRGHFKLKAFLSKRLNLIFIQNGYGKYCLDMEVNDISAVPNPCPYFIEESRAKLKERLTESEKDLLLKVFVANKQELESKINEAINENDAILILTDPLCTLDIRKKIFSDIIDMYKASGHIFLKPHPRDELDYESFFQEYPMFNKYIPMEILEYFPGIHFKKIVGVLTEMSGFTIADDVVRLGPDFLDKYEKPEIHRQNEAI